MKKVELNKDNYIELNEDIGYDAGMRTLKNYNVDSYEAINDLIEEQLVKVVVNGTVAEAGLYEAFKGLGFKFGMKVFKVMTDIYTEALDSLGDEKKK